jgi:hypothetical protein
MSKTDSPSDLTARIMRLAQPQPRAPSTAMKPSRSAFWTAPVATSDRKVWGQGKLWQHNLTLLAPAGSERVRAWAAGPATLPAGKYRVKAYVDRDDRLARDWTATLGAGDSAGAAGFTARWRPGYGTMTAVPAARVTRSGE